MQVRHAPRHERAGAHLPRGVPERRQGEHDRAFGDGHEGARQELSEDGHPAFRGVPGQPRLLLPDEEETVMLRRALTLALTLTAAADLAAAATLKEQNEALFKRLQEAR